ncbi:hypothetical protein DCAR_0935328 [Daucus carota subsp. sativus]|uniref:BED-type domain-containing protein n=1 Tax=Daucus carota subsp. sativus TaxID=79200 RepID=A0AAF0XYI5_DAUCS|nr:hypothetical protein DCAR_0935328 [Daucus carota subsp. sativus]
MITSHAGNDGTNKTVENCIDVDEPEEKQTRKRTSEVWKDFTKVKNSNGIEKAICDHCKKSFVGDSTSGTSHLAMHLKRCTAKIYKIRDRCQDKSRQDLAKMVVKHNYPFNMAKHEFFENFCSGLNPDFRLHSRTTVRSDVIKLDEEIKGHAHYIWTSDSQNIAYAALTVHYIDSEWMLSKKILNYRYISYPHDGESLFRFISQLIMEWNLDKKLFSMVVDNASSNDCI